jgi:hypothetical protein
VSADAAVLRQFYRYLHRSSEPGTVAEPIWPHLPTESSFLLGQSLLAYCQRDARLSGDAPQPLQVCADAHARFLAHIAETLFGKMTRTFLRQIRVKSKGELKERILLGIVEINASKTG